MMLQGFDTVMFIVSFCFQLLDFEIFDLILFYLCKIFPYVKYSYGSKVKCTKQDIFKWFFI